jgi:hypothetical protein
MPKGWPEWRFPPEGPALARALAKGERLAGREESEPARIRWNRLHTVFLAAYGRKDPRPWAALSREARFWLRRGHDAIALAASLAALGGLRGASWTGSGALETGLRDSGPQGLAEEGFARDTAIRAKDFLEKADACGDVRDAAIASLREPAGGGPFADDDRDWDVFPSEALFNCREDLENPYLDYLAAFSGDGGADAGGAGEGKGGGGGEAVGNGGGEAVDNGGGGGQGAGVPPPGWGGADAGDRSARLDALRREMERAGAGSDAGTMKADLARFRYVCLLAGDWTPETGYDDEEVPPEDLAAARELGKDLPKALEGAWTEGGPGPFEAWRLAGAMAFRSGDLKRAERMRLRTFKRSMAALGSLHPITLSLKCELGESLAHEGDPHAVRLVANGAELLEETPSAPFAETVRAKVMLSRVLSRSGDAAGAAAVRLQAADFLERREGRDCRGAVELRVWAGKLLMETGDFRAATGILGACAAAAARAAGSRDLRALALADQHARALLAAGDAGASERVARAALSARRGPGGPAGPEADAGLADTLSILAESLTASGDPVGARAARADECAVRARAQGPGHRATLAALAGEAACAESMGDSSDALALHREALALRAESLGPEDPDTLASKEAVERLTAGGLGGDGGGGHGDGGNGRDGG